MLLLSSITFNYFLTTLCALGHGCNTDICAVFGKDQLIKAIKSFCKSRKRSLLSPLPIIPIPCTYQIWAFVVPVPLPGYVYALFSFLSEQNVTDPTRQSSKIITFKMRQNFCYEYEFDFHGTKRTLSHLNCLILLTWMGNQGCEERTMITCTDRSYLNVCG